MDDECLWELERRMRIADDRSKGFDFYTDDSWYWFDRGCDHDPHGPFASFYDALCDAVRPYMENEEKSE